MRGSLAFARDPHPSPLPEGEGAKAVGAAISGRCLRCVAQAAAWHEPTMEGLTLMSTTTEVALDPDKLYEIVDGQPEEKEISGARHRDRKSTRLNSSHIQKSRMPSSA